jgi:hypothetical protein
MEVEDVASLYGRPIICTMGVRSAASVVKALAAGAAAGVLNTLTSDTASRVMTHVATQVRESLSYVGALDCGVAREGRVHPDPSSVRCLTLRLLSNVKRPDL